MSSSPEPASATPTEIDPRFTCDFTASSDVDEAAGQRWTTWWSVEPLCRGPEPRPDWVVTSRAAVDTELGVLKTGKEADAFLLERAVPAGPSAVMVAKRYRDPEHRSFHRSADYTAGRRTRRSRDTRAVERKSAYGRSLAASQWARSEWDALVRLHGLGLPVPYPVQIDGTELLLEWITHDGETAPRLVQTRPSPALLASYWDQVREVLLGLVEAGLAHGDLSPYNVLAAGDRLVVIDLPQTVDLVANPAGPDFLLRDCTHLATWFRARGLPVDEHELFGELLAAAYSL